MGKMKNDINKAVQDLINDAQKLAATGISEPAPLIVTDETTPNISKFSSEAVLVLSKKINSLLNQHNEIVREGHDGLADFLGKLKLKNAEDFRPSWIRVVDKVYFFGVQYMQHQKQLATDVMISVINDLAKDDVLTGTLAPLSSIDFYVDMPPRKHAMFFYAAVHNKKEQLVEQKYGDFMFPEGGVPKTLEQIAQRYYGEKFMKAFEEMITDAV